MPHEGRVLGLVALQHECILAFAAPNQSGKGVRLGHLTMSDPLTREPYSPDDFYRAFGIAILVWQFVETQLFHFYFSIHEPGALEKAGTEFYGRHSFGPKLLLVDKRALTCLAGTRLAEWRTLHDEMLTASVDRNALAHLTAATDFQSDDTLGLKLAPPRYVPRALVKTNKKYDTAECDRLAFHFEALAKLIDTFTRG